MSYYAVLEMSLEEFNAIELPKECEWKVPSRCEEILDAYQEIFWIPAFGRSALQDFKNFQVIPTSSPHLRLVAYPPPGKLVRVWVHYTH